MKDGKEPSRKKMSKNVAEALRMFNAAIGMESTGRINEALEMYIMASKLDPNIERIAYEMGNKAAAKGRSDSSGATDASESGGGGDGGNGSDGGDGGSGGDGSSSGSSANVNLAELRGPASQFPIEPEVPTTCGHIKDLPHELLVVIMVPGCLPSLDIRQVGKLARVCKRFYATLEDQDIWRRLACILWLGTTGLGTFFNWRSMCHDRPRMNFHGVSAQRINLEDIAKFCRACQPSHASLFSRELFVYIQICADVCKLRWLVPLYLLLAYRSTLRGTRTAVKASRRLVSSTGLCTWSNTTDSCGSFQTVALWQ